MTPLSLRTSWRRPESTSQGRPLDVQLERPRDVSSGRPRDGQIGPSGDELGTLEGDVLGTSWGPISAGWGAASKLEMCMCICRSQPNQSQINETIIELWLCYSVKYTIHKHVAIPKHSTHHLNDLMTVTDTLTA